MRKPTDIRPVGVELYFLPIKTRVPLKFGPGDHDRGDLCCASR